MPGLWPLGWGVRLGLWPGQVEMGGLVFLMGYPRGLVFRRGGWAPL